MAGAAALPQAGGKAVSRTAAAGRLPSRRRPAAGRAVARLVRSWMRCDDGVSSVEFAMFAPMLVFSLLATVDLAFGMTERMKVGHLLRAGAQSAMLDPGEAMVEEAMLVAAGDDAASADLTFEAARFCACPEALDTAVTCDTTCTGSKPTFTYYRLTAERPYTGNFLPTLQFSRAIQVQVR